LKLALNNTQQQPNQRISLAPKPHIFFSVCSFD